VAAGGTGDEAPAAPRQMKSGVRGGIPRDSTVVTTAPAQTAVRARRIGPSGRRRRLLTALGT